ncbi:hypothetical protein LWC33_03405 [Pseudonocardia sp. RS11V-5]|uniref:hypothetical protein n=1 Tax=Pseudonocardia terrae TaxID=2905831 RepID=UPI001E42B16B|nr:hypothetical protein [Pseudonocardia terrae]MCE3550497.1 hypothetical protein [Pseudonocardia terrae]
MYAIVVAVGLAALVGLSVSIGVAVGKEEVEKERNRLKGVEWDLWLRENEIVSVAAVTGCPSCALLRARAELQSPPPG